MRAVEVHVPGHEYPIIIDRGILDALPRLLQERNLEKEVYIITDSNVNDIHAKHIMKIMQNAGIEFRLYTVPAGESSKSMTMTHDLYTRLLQDRASRKATIIAFGGGVVGDLGGFVAATFMRGVNFVQVPTTILSQVDSSVGGKVGINHELGKNLIGAFYQPQFVLIDPEVLNTLPAREIHAGLAEVIKYGLIRDDDFFTFLESRLPALADLSDTTGIEDMLATCCQIKARVVSEDEKESGVRAILNFGHTAGHALEAVTGYRTFLHGEAILHGMRAALHLSVLTDLLSQADADRAMRLVDSMQPPAISSSITVDEIMTAMQRDKKRSTAGQLWVLLTGIGTAHLTRKVSDKHVDEAVRYMLERGVTNV